MTRLLSSSSKTIFALGTALALSAGTATAAWAECTSEASYTVTFNANWVDGVTNYDVPGNAHWSPMVVATHANAGDIYEVGGMASAGVKLVAETGSRNDIKPELDTLFANGTVRAYRTGQRLDGVGQSSVTLSAAPGRSRLTMISMVAPSPDWIVGVNGVELCDGDAWVDSLDLPLMAQDAGTDSGATFAAPNEATSPQEPIQYLDANLELTGAMGEAAVFGTLSIKRN